MPLKRVLPWWAKIGAKVLLARLPARYGFWRRMNLFLHGDMVNPAYALGVVRGHVRHAGRSDLRGCTVLELGPGDSLSTAVIAKALGAQRTILVDAGRFATTEMKHYHALADHLRQERLDPPDLTRCNDVDDMLRRCDASYLTDGVASLQTLPADSVDVVFSHAVLEHVRRRDVPATFRELARVTAPGGVGSHTIDLADHLDDALNNLRFSESIWESEWMAKSGFYTNRIRFAQMCDLMRAAGFVVDVTDTDRFARLPTPRASLTEPYASLPEQELLIRDFTVLVKPA